MPATAIPVPQRRPGARFTPGRNSPGGGKPARGPRPAPADHEILFQKFFKSVGPRTYAAQVKRATNGNHYLVMTEGKRDEKTDEVRKTRLFVYSEDFVEFFRLVKSAAEFVKANPVPEDVRRKREKFWGKQRAGAAGNAPARPVVTPPMPPVQRPAAPPAS